MEIYIFPFDTLFFHLSFKSEIYSTQHFVGIPCCYLYFTPTWFKILITFLGYLDSVNSKLGKSFRTEFNPGTTNLTITEVSRISIQFHPSGRSQRCIVCHTPLLFQYPWFHCNYFLFLLLINLTNRIRKIIILYLISSMNLCANHSLLGLFKSYLNKFSYTNKFDLQNINIYPKYMLYLNVEFCFCSSTHPYT